MNILNINYALMIGIILISSSVNAQTWIKLGSTNTHEFFYDGDGLTGGDDDKNFIVLFKNKIDNLNDAVKSEIFYYSLNCTDRSYIIKSRKRFKDVNAKDFLDETIGKNQTRVTDIKPNTVAVKYFDPACKTKELQSAGDQSKRISDEKEAVPKQTDQENLLKADLNNELEQLKVFLNRKVDWIFSIKNSYNFPVYFSPQEIYITRNNELIVNALIQYNEHNDGGISSIITLKVSDCFSNNLPSFTRIRFRYFSEINGKGLVIKDNVLNEESITLQSWVTSGMVWHTIARDACTKAKGITANSLQKYEAVQKQLSLLNTQAGIEFYKKYQAEDEKNTKKIRLALEDESRRKNDAQERARAKALEGKILFAGLVNILNTGTLTGSCQSVFSHLAIQTNKLYAQTISKPAKNQDDEFRNRKEADQYLRAGELGSAFSKRINNSFSKNVPPSELSDYFQSVNESMYKMQNLNDAKIAYQAYNYCRNKF